MWWAACTTRHYASAALWAENMRIFKLSSVFQTHWKKQIIYVHFRHTVFLCVFFATGFQRCNSVCFRNIFFLAYFANVDNSVINIRLAKELSAFNADHVIVSSRGVKVSKKYSYDTDRLCIFFSCLLTPSVIKLVFLIY